MRYNFTITTKDKITVSGLSGVNHLRLSDHPGRVVNTIKTAKSLSNNYSLKPTPGHLDSTGNAK